MKASSYLAVMIAFPSLLRLVAHMRVPRDPAVDLPSTTSEASRSDGLCQVGF